MRHRNFPLVDERRRGQTDLTTILRFLPQLPGFLPQLPRVETLGFIFLFATTPAKLCRNPSLVIAKFLVFATTPEGLFNLFVWGGGGVVSGFFSFVAVFAATHSYIILPVQGTLFFLGK